ncbi:hypothetical protein BJ322DRAFT_1032859 [Thelephora terrestris]|uniref:Uncharacterized protein n=1 Tax=Thelephora terrestris TaxID=56493 RepID=A0A9P6LD02_9AGAM|nr:hypothetical protein BJ322DRAFT_1032859 [Thelephora terrestris]
MTWGFRRSTPPIDRSPLLHLAIRANEKTARQPPIPDSTSPDSHEWRSQGPLLPHHMTLGAGHRFNHLTYVTALNCVVSQGITGCGYHTPPSRRGGGSERRMDEALRIGYLETPCPVPTLTPLNHTHSVLSEHTIRHATRSKQSFIPSRLIGSSASFSERGGGGIEILIRRSSESVRSPRPPECNCGKPNNTRKVLLGSPGFTHRVNFIANCENHATSPGFADPIWDLASITRMAFA